MNRNTVRDVQKDGMEEGGVSRDAVGEQEDGSGTEVLEKSAAVAEDARIRTDLRGMNTSKQ